MNKQAIFTFIKKHVLSISCVIVAIAAVVLIFYPLSGMISDLQTEADAHAQLYQELTTLSKTRKMPMSDPNQADPGNLPGFPNSNTIKAGQDAVERFAKASQKMLDMVTNMNQQGHNPLVPDELPKETFEHTPFDFAHVYGLVLSTDPAIRGRPDSTAKPPIAADPTLASFGALNLQNDVLDGGLPPTSTEISQAAHDLWDNTYAPQIVTRNGQPVNIDDLNAQFKVATERLPLRMKNEVARKHKIYVEKQAFTIDPNITTDRNALISEIWYAQLQLWIQQDLAAGIAEANKDSASILDSEVKRLISMQVPLEGLYVQPPASAAAATTGTPPIGDDKSAIPPNYAIGVTGRYCNGMYDVSRFTLVVDVDASRVNQFIETLENRRLITITNESEYAIDPEVEASRGYLYGTGSVVRLVLDGEELFLRSWTKELMPEAVQITQGLIPPKAGVTPAMPVQSPYPGMGRPPGMYPGGGMPPGMDRPPYPGR